MDELSEYGDTNWSRKERGYITPPWIRAPQAARIAGGMEPARLVNKQCGIARNSSQALIPSTFQGEKRDLAKNVPQA